MTVLRPRHRSDSTALRGSISIAAPPETVWDLITTIDTIPEWYDTWHAVEHETTDPRLKVGTSFRLIRHRTGRRDDTAQCRVTDLSEPTRVEWAQSSAHMPTVTVQFLLMHETTTGTTLLDHNRTWATR